MVAFINTETLSNEQTDEKLFDSFANAAGFGFRFSLNKRSKTNLCFDIGFGEGLEGRVLRRPGSLLMKPNPHHGVRQVRRVAMRRLLLLGAACGLTLLSVGPAQAQLNGSHTLGDFGVKSGTQPAPGFYAALFYLHYGTDTIKDVDGTRSDSRRTSEQPRGLGLCSDGWYVSKTKFLGANYGAMVVLPFANASLEAPAFQLGQTVDTSFSDMLVRPLDLGWHTTHADIAAGLQLYVPTGRYERGGSDNIGKGMWTYEPFVGATVYFDEKKTFSLATTAYWEFHGRKEDSNVKVGQILTLEGGLGKSFLGGGLIIGAAYYAQWKLTKDQLAGFELPGGGDFDVTARNKHKVFGFGPDVTLPIATKSKLFALVNIRYLWETGARVKTKGRPWSSQRPSRFPA